MKPTLALLASVLLGVGMSACGTGARTDGTSRVTPDAASAHKGSAATSSTAIASSPDGYLKYDGDKDFDDTQGGRNDPEYDSSILFSSLGGRASAADTQAVTTLVKSYFAASAAEDGARACSLLAAGLADGLQANQSQSAGSPHDRCANSLSSLLAQQHSQLVADDVATMVVTSVHVKGNLGVAALGFRAAPESEILVEREGHTWKIDALFAGLMP
jgi:hypothetical protein